MARVTVEDCLRNVDNRFHLVLVATKRARQLATTGEEPLVPWDNDKPTVVALREIAAGFIKDGQVCDPNAEPAPPEPEQPVTPPPAAAPTFMTGGITLESASKANFGPSEQSTPAVNFRAPESKPDEAANSKPEVSARPAPKLTVPPLSPPPAADQTKTDDKEEDNKEEDNKDSDKPTE